MNKAFYIKRCISSFMLIGCLILFTLSCGLDTFYVIDAPTSIEHKPEYNSIEKSDFYFEFWTVVPDDDLPIKFFGTNVYYKIYKSSSKLENEVQDLYNISNKDDSSTSAARKMIETYGYQPLRAAGHLKEAVLIPTSADTNADYFYNSNSKVYIRLNDYSDTYFAQITVNNVNIYNSSTRILPVRNVENKLSFNFPDLDSSDLPKDGDVDVNSNGSSSEDELYVSMYAVGIAQDNTFSSVYSNILYLGSVTIPTK